MKLPIIFLSFLSFQILHAQQVVDGWPTIALQDIEIKKSDSPSIKFDCLADQIIESFGMPSSREDYYYEMDETTGEWIKYTVNDFYIIYEKFYAFDVRNDDFEIGLNGNFISVGNNMSIFSDFFPEYQAHMSNGALSLYFFVNGDVWDSRLIFEYDEQGTITRIMRYDP